MIFHSLSLTSENYVMIMNIKKIVYVLWYGNRNLSRNCERLPAYSSNILAYMTNLGNEKKKVKNKLVHFRKGICILPKMIPPEHRKTLNKNCARGQQKTSWKLKEQLFSIRPSYPRSPKYLQQISSDKLTIVS